MKSNGEGVHNVGLACGECWFAQRGIAVLKDVSFQNASMEIRHELYVVI